MPVPRLRGRSSAWLRWPRRTARLRFSALYASLLLVSGAVLLAITYLLFERATEYKKPSLPTIPPTPAIQHLGALPALAQAQHQLTDAQQELAQALPLPSHPLSPLALAQYRLNQALPPLKQAQHQLAEVTPAGFSLKKNPGLANLFDPKVTQAQDQLALVEHQLTLAAPKLTQAQNQLLQGRHQLAKVAQQLAQAVRQLSRAGPAQAAQRSADSHQLLVNSGVALAIVAVLALLAGWLVAGRMLRPIRTITRTAQRISSTSLHERLALEGPQDELKELGDTLDQLFGRLDAAFDAQRHFVANASHELRTPLTAERTMLQFALDDPRTSAKTWRSIAEELLASNREQETLIEALLALASSEGGLDHRERTDLADICRTVLARQDARTERLGLVVETTICTAPVEGDPRLIERLAANLVDNAMGHNVAGGHVQISSGVSEGKAVLSVSNTGPVVPSIEVDRLFQPFQRLDGRRGHRKDGHGHGLGLSIVQAIATAHGAAITASALPGGGLSVDVSFAFAPAPDAVGDRGLRGYRQPATNRADVRLS